MRYPNNPPLDPANLFQGGIVTSGNINVKNFDILRRLLLVRFNALNPVNNIQALDCAAKNGVFVVKPRLEMNLVRNRSWSQKKGGTKHTVFSVVMKN